MLNPIYSVMMSCATPRDTWCKNNSIGFNLCEIIPVLTISLEKGATFQKVYQPSSFAVAYKKVAPSEKVAPSASEDVDDEDPLAADENWGAGGPIRRSSSSSSVWLSKEGTSRLPFGKIPHCRAMEAPVVALSPVATATRRHQHRTIAVLMHDD
jgi:hypothetical protein